jgi:hypothetical protein
MTDGLFDPTTLPEPATLRRRHVALVLVDECFSGVEADGAGYQLSTSEGGAELAFFTDGSGDDYGIALPGDEALLWVFDHECPYSPRALDDERLDWPGMLDGLPPHLAEHLPLAGVGMPREISALYWFTGGEWHMGDPAPATEEPGPYLSDPQGVGGLVGPLLGPVQDGVEELVVDYHERPERLDAAKTLAALVDDGEPVTREVLVELDPKHGADTMLARASALGVAG